MKSLFRSCSLGLWSIVAVTCSFAVPAGAQTSGTLRVLAANPRYFTDNTGKAIYLSGSHTWTNLRDRQDLPTFDFPGYLNFLESHHHNFIRLWVSNYNTEYEGPYTYSRTGPGNANDGKPKFDLTQFDQSYFDRVRARVIAARDRGFFVSIMLFQEHARLAADWDREAFNLDNNKNGIDGDPNGDGSGIETYSMSIPAIVALHEAYVRKMVDTVNDLDNVLFEICNEAPNSSSAWQLHLIDYIKQYEATKPKQHPVGMTFQFPDGSNQTLYNSNAEWISPNDSPGYTSSPPEADGRKVVLVDTDHLCGECSNEQWPWKNFLRGQNFLLMDPYYNASGYESTRKAMGYTVDYARRMDLVHMTPRSSLSSTGYVLANPGQAYLVYQPSSGAFTVNMDAATYNYEWFDPSAGTVKGTGLVAATGGNRTWTPPFSGSAVLYLYTSTSGTTPSSPTDLTAQ